MKCIQCGSELATGDIGQTCTLCKMKNEGQRAYLQGWECPRCHKIHSPFITTCDCPPNVVTKTSYDTKIDTSHLCTICHKNWVDSDNGFDTCDSCMFEESIKK